MFDYGAGRGSFERAAAEIGSPLGRELKRGGVRHEEIVARKYFRLASLSFRSNSDTEGSSANSVEWPEKTLSERK